ncbi:MAG: ribonuclease H-like domain-containing protein [Candidatus Gottesmanbacteria bacterium]|nr:ribonuclease H-like domain-containing protein [Candidatus Gottesmanbacteria bacterium]
MITEVIFDCETQKLFNEISGTDPGALGISVVSLYVRTVDDFQRELTGTMRSFWKDELYNMWKYFSGAQRIIGFNSVKFDVPALKKYSPTGFEKLPHFDIMKIVRDTLGFSLSLNHLASQTLGKYKSDVGTNAVVYWKKGDAESLAKLKSYCEADVLLTKNLYDFGVTNKKLKYLDKWNTTREIPVDFSYPRVVIDASRQIGLF